MPAPRVLIVYALMVAAVAALFALFIGFKHDAALVAALEAAGTVTAAGFAALAAMGSMRAAAESSASAKRAQEALARTVRPRVHPSAARENGRAYGRVHCDQGPAAVDVTVVWLLRNRTPITERTGRLEPARPDLATDADATFTVDLDLPETVNMWNAFDMVWIEYWDEGHVGRWQDTWRVNTGPDGQGAFLQVDSQLVD